MFKRTLALILFALVASCSFKIEGDENAKGAGRYEVTRLNELTAILLDTTTGKTWYTMGDGTWQPCAGGPSR